MRTITLQVKPKSSFQRIAEQATDIARNQKVLVRFTMGPASARQTFVASPKKSPATLAWEWAKSTAGLLVKQAQRVRRVKAAA